MAALSVPARGRCRLALRAYEITPFCVCEPVQITYQPESLFYKANLNPNSIYSSNLLSNPISTSAFQAVALTENLEIAAKEFCKLTYVSPST
jgi:hypothetical protein